MGRVNSTDTPSDSSVVEDEVLRAQLAIQPHPDSNCAVVNRGADSESLTQSLKRPEACLEKSADNGAARDCGECHAEVSFEDSPDGTHEYLKSTVHEKCICPVFEEYDCIPDIKGVRDGAVIAVVTVRNRTVLREILAELRDVDANISIDWLVRGRERDAIKEINVGEITSKQKEALETALEAGYYSTPRETDLAELGDQLSISESAVSQRLNAAETKLVRSFLEE